MATSFSHDCPHCGTQKSGFIIIGIKNYPFETAKGPVVNTQTRVSNWSLRYSCGAMCPICNEPVSAVFEHTSQQPAQQVSTGLITHVTNSSGNIEILGFKIIDVWPKPPKPQIPEYLPEPITRAFSQAESNFRQAGNEEASAMMYRRALELAIKDKYPTLAGVLAKRVKELVAQKEIPAAMGDWADEIRDLGNEAAHDQGAVDKRELTMVRGFADALLKYLYTLPAEIEARRKLP